MGKKTNIFSHSLLGVLLLLQIYPSHRPEVTETNPNDLLKNKDVPKNIASMLRSAYYDCHSNKSTYPWYASIAPVKWWVYNYMKERKN